MCNSSVWRVPQDLTFPMALRLHILLTLCIEDHMVTSEQLQNLKYKLCKMRKGIGDSVSIRPTGQTKAAILRHIWF